MVLLKSCVPFLLISVKLDSIDFSRSQLVTVSASY